MTTAIPSLDAILAAPAVVVPGLSRWLGIPEVQADGEPEETYEALCERLSKAVTQ